MLISLHFLMTLDDDDYIHESSFVLLLMYQKVE